VIRSQLDLGPDGLPVVELRDPPRLRERVDDLQAPSAGLAASSFDRGDLARVAVAVEDLDAQRVVVTGDERLDRFGAVKHRVRHKLAQHEQIDV
jgi:hypothetical protein